MNYFRDLNGAYGIKLFPVDGICLPPAGVSEGLVRAVLDSRHTFTPQLDLY